MTLRYLSLFSGIGGFDLGFDRAGMECAGQVEIDPFCQRVLAKHWPDVKRIADIREVQGNEFGSIDLICGGFPCQPHSLAGQRRGAADDRELWPEYRRLIDAIRPRWVVGENVPDIRTTILDDIFADLEGLDYTATALIIPAGGVNSPQLRYRLFVVAHAEGQPVRPGLRPDEPTGERGRRSPHSHSASEPWPFEPGVGRVAYGVSDRMDRLRTLGNAVVPQVTEWLGRRIVAAEMEVNPQ